MIGRPEEPDGEPIARRMWRSLETLHSIVYFAPETKPTYGAVGLIGTSAAGLVAGALPNQRSYRLPTDEHPVSAARKTAAARARVCLICFRPMRPS